MAELSKKDKNKLDSSYEFGYSAFCECLKETKDKNLDTEAVGMEILFQAVHFLETKGWSEDEILEYVKNAYKDALGNKLYQNELSKVKTAHRKAGKLTGTERAIIAKEKKMLKKVDVAKEIKTEELAAAKPAAEEPAVAEA